MSPRWAKPYVIARNRNDRPTVQHKVHPQDSGLTGCGRETGEWSRAYMAEKIPEVYCRASGCKEES